MLNTYCDLNTFLRKPLVIKGLDVKDFEFSENGEVVEKVVKEGKKFIIPPSIPLSFVIKISGYIKEQEAISKGELVLSDEEVKDRMEKLVLEIINLNNKKFTIKDVRENFDDLFTLQIIIKQIINYIYNIQADPNSNSQKSE